MALDGDALGTLLYNERVAFSNKKASDLITTYGTIENARLEAAKAEANVIVNYFKANTVVIPTALIAPQNVGPVTGTGTIL